VLGTFEQPNAHIASALMRHLEGSSEVFRYHDLRAGEFYDHNRFWTCNVSAPAERVREAGNFDERFKRYGCEDIDLGLRLERLGLRVCYHAGARAHHDHLLDFEALRRRQLACSASFVHLFAKHPSELDHPDWAWLAGRGVDSMRAELAQRAERREVLEGALATLARVELPPLEALGERELVAQTLARLRAILAELNALWWQAGLVQGLTEVGVASFAELRAREPQTTFGGWRAPDFSAEHARTQLALLRTEARTGQSALATLRAIGLCCALERSAHADLFAEALSDLEVLREYAGPRATAMPALRAEASPPFGLCSTRAGTANSCASSHSALPSLEPSSTITSSKLPCGASWASKLATLRCRISRRWYVHRITESSGADSATCVRVVCPARSHNSA